MKVKSRILGWRVVTFGPIGARAHVHVQRRPGGTRQTRLCAMGSSVEERDTRVEMADDERCKVCANVAWALGMGDELREEDDRG